MRALQPRVMDTVFSAAVALLPSRPPDTHPLGCHRPRTDDRTCFVGMVYRLALGCSWQDAGMLAGTSASTLRRRRDEWAAAGVFDRLAEEAIAAYDRICGLDLSEVAIDGSQAKAPCGGEGTGRNPTDRGKLGWKWSVATDAAGIPIGWAANGANRHDIILLAPTLDGVVARGLVGDIETVHLDRGYDADTVRQLLLDRGIHDAQIARRRRRGEPEPADPQPLRLGLRWTVERTNSWLSNFGQLRRNTDRSSAHRLAQLALAIVVIVTAKLIDWRDRWSP